MPLDAYRQKRAFDRTPEPDGKTKPISPSSDGGRFVVQKHAARRLHYDLRLEVDGVLKSWAVPKGPSMDPAEKRLAVMTEDHPMEYAEFEGVIPPGNYGAGTMEIWDAGRYVAEGKLSIPQQLEKGDLKFCLNGNVLHGSFALVRMKDKEWLLIKHRDAWANLSADVGTLEGARLRPAPEETPVMLAMIGKESFSDPGWLFEMKWDGMRALARVKEGRLELRARSGRVVTGQFPELAGLPDLLKAREAILDGEIVVLDEKGRSDFERMQPRMHTAKPTAALLKAEPVDYYVFDVLYCDGLDLRGVPLMERKRVLRHIMNAAPPIRFSDHVLEQGRELFALAREHGAEGVVAKQIQSPYTGGRSPAWLKLKVTRELDAVIGGFTAPRGSRQHFGALLLGIYEEGRLRFIGGAGTGFTEARLKQIQERLDKLRTDKCPFEKIPETMEAATWVKPELVARVKYGEWTDEGRLRAPVFLGLRNDLDPADCQAEAEPSPVAAESAVARSAELEEELERGTADSMLVNLDGRQIRLNNLNKIYFPEKGYTKRQLFAYYYRAADAILPFLRNRALVLRRHPNGIHGNPFYQKAAGLEKPDWITTVAIHSEGRNEKIPYYVANDLSSLLFLVNLGCVEHNPWSSSIDDLERPDYVFFDLDPVEGTDFATVVRVGRTILELLEKTGCRFYIKTSGATGLHIYLPLEPVYTYDHVRTFAEIFARLVLSRLPKEVTLERMVEKRKAGTVYVDYSQNAYGRPLASVYSVRPVPEATVSAPVSAKELKPSLTPSRFTLANMPERLRKTGDLWSGFWKDRQKLEPLLEALQGELSRG